MNKSIKVAQAIIPVSFAYGASMYKSYKKWGWKNKEFFQRAELKFEDLFDTKAALDRIRQVSAQMTLEVWEEVVQELDLTEDDLVNIVTKVFRQQAEGIDNVKVMSEAIEDASAFFDKKAA